MSKSSGSLRWIVLALSFFQDRFHFQNFSFKGHRLLQYYPRLTNLLVLYCYEHAVQGLWTGWDRAGTGLYCARHAT